MDVGGELMAFWEMLIQAVMDKDARSVEPLLEPKKKEEDKDADI